MKILFLLCAAAVLHPAVSSGLALLGGVAFTIFLKNPFSMQTKRYASQLLMISVVGLGFGMDLNVIGAVGLQGVGYTFTTIFATMLIGLWIGAKLRIPLNSSVLLCAGTAICGGSAIAAVAPAINAKSEETSVALGTVFLLNSLALFTFPTIGHWLSLDQGQFGLWSALSIHDTSSVVGASLQYGPEALAVGTTVKLARALWIAPLTLTITFFRKNRDAKKTFKFPWFIIGFVLASALITYLPETKIVGESLAVAARRALVLTLFLIGANLNKDVIKAVGVRPLIQGLALWIIVAVTTALAVTGGLI